MFKTIGKGMGETKGTRKGNTTGTSNTNTHRYEAEVRAKVHVYRKPLAENLETSSNPSSCTKTESG